jgi:hypothetical protein
MLNIPLAIGATLILLTTPAFAQSVESYDEGWYRAPFWSGEYPGGFSVARTTTVHLRPTIDPKAEKSIACDLPQGATYQIWNHDRVDEQGLAFTSFTRIADYKVLKPFETTLHKAEDSSEVPMSFKAGDEWRYLVYYAEGNFRIEYGGVQYDADQEMFDHSEQMGDTNGYEEWLRINCSNNQWGWLFMGDISLDGGNFLTPNITEYGSAEDLK